MSESAKGALFALSAYFMWGLIPLYFSLLDAVTPLEILAHRIIWSLVFLIALIAIAGKWHILIASIKVPANLRWLILSSLLIAANWLTYIWALQNDQVIDASLGYYINPMVSVVLAMLFLGERLRRLQIAAVFVACLGVAHEIIVVGKLPLVALMLAVSFGFYGLVRKKVAVDSIVGLFIETTILLPVALLYFAYLITRQENVFGNASLEINTLLLGLGLLTTLPLLCFGSAALRMPLTTLGFYQYLAPSIVLLLAITVYGEPFTQERAITFGLILVAVLLFSLEALFFGPQRLAVLQRLS